MVAANPVLDNAVRRSPMAMSLEKERVNQKGRGERLAMLCLEDIGQTSAVNDRTLGSHRFQ